MHTDFLGHGLTRMKHRWVNSRIRRSALDQCKSVVMDSASLTTASVADCLSRFRRLRSTLMLSAGGGCSTRLHQFHPRYPRLLSLCDADVFRLGEEAKGFLAAFAANAAGLHPTEGDTQVAHEP